MIRIIEPRLGEVDVQHGIIGMPGKDSRRKIPVVLGVVPGIPHDVLVDIQQAVPTATLGELLHPLAPGGVDVLLLVVAGAEHHQVVALKAVVVNDELSVIHLPGMGGLGVLHSFQEQLPPWAIGF